MHHIPTGYGCRGKRPAHTDKRQEIRGNVKEMDSRWYGRLTSGRLIRICTNTNLRIHKAQEFLKVAFEITPIYLRGRGGGHINTETDIHDLP